MRLNVILLNSSRASN